MTFLWIALWAVIGFVVVVAILGAWLHCVGKSLPVDHSYTCRVTLAQPVEKVSEVIADVANWPSWDPGVQRVEGATDAVGVFRGKMFMGRNVMGVESHRVAPPTKHEIRVEDLRMKVFSGVWRYELTPMSSGCTVSLTEDGRIHAALPRAMVRRCANPRMYLMRHLKLLGKRFGEEARIETVA